ncbi:MAG: class I SAM-dependent methyltransferase [Candidatus Geothermincolia bacterium]
MENDKDQTWSKIADDYYKVNYQEVQEYPSLLVRHRYFLDIFDQYGKAVLDVGCGPGEMVIDLLSRGCDVTGVDLSPEMIELAKKNVRDRLPEKNPDLQVGNIERLPFTAEKFDGIVCAGVIEYLDRDDRALGELNRVLKKDGTLIISVRNRLCPARVFDLIFDPLKKWSWSRAILNAAKRMAQGKAAQPILYFPYRKHSAGQIHSSLRKSGFEIVDHRYFHFYPFFAVFEKIFLAAYVRTGLKMEKLTSSRIGWLGSGYIVKARKVG